MTTIYASFSIDGINEHDTMLDCVVEYIDQYWVQQERDLLWQHFGMPVPLLPVCVTVTIKTNDGVNLITEREVVEVADCNEVQSAGRFIALDELNSHYAITLLEDPERGHTTSATFADTFLYESAKELLGQLAIVTIMDRGDGPCLIDIEPSLT